MQTPSMPKNVNIFHFKSNDNDGLNHLSTFPSLKTHLPFPLLTWLQATSQLLPFLDPPSILIVDLLQANVV